MQLSKLLPPPLYPPLTFFNTILAAVVKYRLGTYQAEWV